MLEDPFWYGSSFVRCLHQRNPRCNRISAKVPRLQSVEISPFECTKCGICFQHDLQNVLNYALTANRVAEACWEFIFVRGAKNGRGSLPVASGAARTVLGLIRRVSGHRSLPVGGTLEETAGQAVREAGFSGATLDPRCRYGT